MNFAFRKGLIWLIITVCIFATFRWLFGLAMPDAALSFATGITVIILGGLFMGSSVSKILTDVDQRKQRTLLLVLRILILTSFVGMAMLVNRMIENTEFFHFSITILLLFFLSACSSALFNVIRNRIRVKIHAVQTAMVHSKSELQVLQSQLSPHFLFNTLNNMYGLSLTDPARVPALLLKLSDLLRYSIYETKELFVPIQHEVDYLNNYIEFEKVRLGERLLL